MSIATALQIIKGKIDHMNKLDGQMTEALREATNEDQRIGTSLLLDQNRLFLATLISVKAELEKDV